MRSMAARAAAVKLAFNMQLLTKTNQRIAAAPAAYGRDLPYGRSLELRYLKVVRWEDEQCNAIEMALYERAASYLRMCRQYGSMDNSHLRPVRRYYA